MNMSDIDDDDREQIMEMNQQLLDEIERGMLKSHYEHKLSPIITGDLPPGCAVVVVSEDLADRLDALQAGAKELYATAMTDAVLKKVAGAS